MERTPKDAFIDTLIDNEKRLAIAIVQEKTDEEIAETIGYTAEQTGIMRERLATFDVVEETEEGSEDAPAPEAPAAGAGEVTGATDTSAAPGAETTISDAVGSGDPAAPTTGDAPVADATTGDAPVVDENTTGTPEVPVDGAISDAPSV